METKVITVRAQVIELAVVLSLLVLLCLVCPIVQFNNQFFIGPMVNCTLIYAGVRFKGFLKTASIVCLPSACAITLGMLGFTGIYAMYMIPFIWAGNTAIVLGFKYLFSKRNYVTTAVVSIAVKAALIFGGYYLLLTAGAIPAGSPIATVMWSAMGVYQLITAAAGSVLAFGVLRLVRR